MTGNLPRVAWNEYAVGLRCLHCGRMFPLGPSFEGCPDCRGPEFASNLWVEYDWAALRPRVERALLTARGQGLSQYTPLLPISEGIEPLSLREGNTPLLPAPTLATADWPEVWLKDETRNPTFSWKDRFCLMAVAVGKAHGYRTVCVASSGNHGAAAAAYARRAGMECVVITTANPLPAMVAQIHAYGARVLRAEGTERWRIMDHCVREYGWWPVGNYTWPMASGNPYGVEGYKTIAYEIWRDLGARVPDVVVVPTARGEGLAGIWKGFRELADLGLADRLPRMVSTEPDAGGPLAQAVRAGHSGRQIRMIQAGKTVSVSIGGGLTSVQAVDTIQQSGGWALTVSDEETLAAKRRLAGLGILAEASSATALAGLLRLRAEVPSVSGHTAVLVLTGSGLKDSIPAVGPGVGPAVAQATADDFAAVFRKQFGIEPATL